MKLDKENSKKNILVQDLDLIEEQLTKIETSNGRLSIICAITSFNIFAGLLNAIYTISVENLNVALGILNVVIMILSGLVLDRCLVKITKNNELKEELELKMNNIIQEFEKDMFLERQSKELGKVLCKKNNIVYFPQK